MLWTGCGHEEPAGEEHEAGEHVLEDLEFGPQEEAGIFSLSFICPLSLSLKFMLAFIYLE